MMSALFIVEKKLMACEKVQMCVGIRVVVFGELWGGWSVAMSRVLEEKKERRKK